MRDKAKLLSLFLVPVIIVACCTISCTARPDSIDDVYSTVRNEAEPYRFKFVLWEIQAFITLATNKFTDRNSDTFASTLRSQIKTILQENSIAAIPPLQFRIEEPPHLLVISPRDRIEYFDRLLLRQQLNMADMEKIEAEVDKFGVSSLVVELGGFGATYPPIVSGNASINYIIDSAVEEWLHQYLAFKPLGFRYLLDSIGITQQPDVIIMNESLAGIVSEEIGAEVYNRYYDGIKEDVAGEQQSTFDFNAEMRKTRKQVDLYLSIGDIETAEQYMEARRQIFVAHGYRIRKLNQAYFAFHGIYGDDPASVSPIYSELEQLRVRSPSLKDFLETTSGMTEYSDLQHALEK